MRIRLMTFVLVALAVAGSLVAAESPFAGTWKLNPAKSKLTGDTMKFEKTASGAIRCSGSGLSFDFNTDGKEYKGPMGEIMVWKQVDDHTWLQTTKQKGILISTDTYKLSADGKTLTDISKGTKPNGATFEDTTVYERISGDKGLLGGWRDKEVKVSSPAILEIKASGEDGLVLKSVGYKWTCDFKFDGKDYAVTGPTVPSGLSASMKRLGPRSFELVSKKDGKPLVRETYTVTADGRTLTVAGSPVAVNEPYTSVFERQ
jgi:hypothetical protein